MLDAEQRHTLLIRFHSAITFGHDEEVTS